MTWVRLACAATAFVAACGGGAIQSADDGGSSGNGGHGGSNATGGTSAGGSGAAGGDGAGGEAGFGADGGATGAGSGGSSGGNGGNSGAGGSNGGTSSGSGGASSGSGGNGGASGGNGGASGSGGECESTTDCEPPDSECHYALCSAAKRCETYARESGYPCSLGHCAGSGTESRCIECVLSNHCDDQSNCTTDRCEGNVCKHTINPGFSCNDRDSCTLGDTCDFAGACAGDSVSDPCQSGDVRARFAPQNANAVVSQLNLRIEVDNDGEAEPLTLRYWYTTDGNATQERSSTTSRAPCPPSTSWP